MPLPIRRAKEKPLKCKMKILKTLEVVLMVAMLDDNDDSSGDSDNLEGEDNYI